MPIFEKIANTSIARKKLRFATRCLESFLYRFEAMQGLDFTPARLRILLHVHRVVNGPAIRLSKPRWLLRVSSDLRTRRHFAHAPQNAMFEFVSL